MKIQKFQKLAYFGVLISVALLFIYSLICGSPAYCLRPYAPYVKVTGFVYKNFLAAFNSFNMTVLYLAIVGFICFALFAIYNQGNRKIFYLSNFIVPIIFAVYSVVVAILLLPNIISFSSSYTEYINAIDMNKVPSYVSMMWLPDTSFVIVIGMV